MRYTPTYSHLNGEDDDNRHLGHPIFRQQNTSYSTAVCPNMRDSPIFSRALKIAALIPSGNLT